MSVRLRKWKDKEGIVQDTWIVDVKYKHADGSVQAVRQTSPIQTRRGAEQHERQLRESLQNRTYGKEVTEVPTLSNFKERFLIYSDNNNKPSAVLAKRLALKNHIEPVFGNTRLDKIFAPEVEAYKARKLREKLSAKTVNNHLAVLRKLLNLAVEWGELSHAPRIRQLRVPLKDFQFLTCDESERFLEAADSSWRTMLTVALKTGVRLGELLALKWEDVDLRTGKIVVRRTLWQKQEGTPKGGRSREIPLSEVAKACLQRQRHLKGPYVFCKSDGSRFSHSEVKGVVPLTCQRAGLAKRLTWHHLRHSFASHLVMRGVPLKSVQELMGHASIEMTMRYAHLSPHVNRSAVDLLDLPVQDRRTYGGHGT